MTRKEQAVHLIKYAAIQDTYEITTKVFEKGETMDREHIESAIKGLLEAAEWLKKHGAGYQGKWCQLRVNS